MFISINRMCPMYLKTFTGSWSSLRKVKKSRYNINRRKVIVFEINTDYLITQSHTSVLLLYHFYSNDNKNRDECAGGRTNRVCPINQNCLFHQSTHSLVRIMIFLLTLVDKMSITTKWVCSKKTRVSFCFNEILI